MRTGNTLVSLQLSWRVGGGLLESRDVPYIDTPAAAAEVAAVTASHM